MPVYLVAISQELDSQALFKRALSEAKSDGAELSIVSLVTPSGDQQVSGLLIEQSLLAPAAALEAARQVERTQLKHATARLAELAKLCEEAGVPYRTTIVTGSIDETANKVAEASGADRLYFHKTSQSLLGRLLFPQTSMEGVVENAACQVVVVDE